MVPKPQGGTRAALFSASKGLGRHFTSPRKVKNPRKTQTYVSFPGQDIRQQRLLAHLEDLRGHQAASPRSRKPSDDIVVEDSIVDTEMIVIDGAEESPPDHETSAYEGAERISVAQHIRNDHFFNSWKSIIPTIVRPYLEYLAGTLGKPLPQRISSLSACSKNCDKKLTNITCLYFDCKPPFVSNIDMTLNTSSSVCVYRRLVL